MEPLTNISEEPTSSIFRDKVVDSSETLKSISISIWHISRKDQSLEKIHLSLFLHVHFMPVLAMGKFWTLFSVAFIYTQPMALYGCPSNTIRNWAIGFGVVSDLGLMWCSEAQNAEQCISSVDVENTVEIIFMYSRISINEGKN